MRREKIEILEKKGANISTRDQIIKKNILRSSFLKFIALGLSFVLVPAMLNYLSTEEYGIWLILLSMLSWISFMDIGLGNGLRNKLAESISKNDLQGAKEYISTAYAAIMVISIVTFLLISIAILFLDWTILFNTDSVTNTELKITVFIVVFFFLLNFVLSLSNQLFYAVQKSALTGLTAIMLNGILLGLVAMLNIFSQSNLIYISICYGVAMVTSSSIMTFHFFKNHSDLKPSIRLIKKEKIREISQLGFQFFIIQIAAVIIFTTDNMIITQLFGPNEVIPYNIVRKLFGIIIIGHTIIVTPLWSAYTEAYSKNDINWMKKTLLKTNYFILAIIPVIVLLVLLSNRIFVAWIGKDVKIPLGLVFVMAVYSLVHVWNNNYSYLLNGIGKIRISLVTALIGAVINIPLSILFAKYFNFGITGVVIGTICSLLPFSFTGPIETYILLHEKKAGIIQMKK